MNILITGAAGSVGAASARYFSERHKVLPLNHDDLDIIDPEAVRRTILSEKPEVIINCAVMGVDACEDDPLRARQINVEGPRNLAAAAALVNAEMLHFSSNYVFDGRLANSAYTIADAPNPINEYGRTKLEGERAVAAALPRSYVVRTSWVYGGCKPNFLSMVPRRLISGQRFSAITDVRASTTFVVDLVRRVGEILTHRRYGTYHVVNSGVCSYFEFAGEAARILDLATSAAANLIEAVSENDMKRKAKRPRYSPMQCLVSEELRLAPLRDWRHALLDCVRSQVPHAGE